MSEYREGVAALDSLVINDRGVEYGTVADLIRAQDTWMDGQLYRALSVAYGVLYNRGVNPTYGPEFYPGASAFPELIGTLVQTIVLDALAGIPHVHIHDFSRILYAERKKAYERGVRDERSRNATRPGSGDMGG